MHWSVLWVRFVSPDPSLFMMNVSPPDSWQSLVKLLLNTIFVPSGDHRPSYSWRLGVLVRLTSPVPSGWMVYRSNLSNVAPLSNRIRLPSGDQLGLREPAKTTAGEEWLRGNWCEPSALMIHTSS